jgi:hypothetical protein
MTMNTLRILSLAVVASACTSTVVGPEDLAPSAPQAAQHVVLRLRGIAPASYQAVLLDVKNVAVAADDVALDVSPPSTRFDLADSTQGWSFGEVDVPAGARNVHVSLTFDDFGGFQDAAGAAGDIDSRTIPVEIDATMADVATHGKMIVQLDVGRSLLAVAADRRLLLPSLSVAY